ncbi:MAG: hypothetical protein QOH61_1176, partial [Chloroflexota bacterium]|nr:hypothetical protein [Chloroflexota bacterium]
QQPAEVKDHLVVIAASIGRATALGPARGTDDLLSEADKAMYEEKRLRSNRRTRFGPAGSEAGLAASGA